MSAENTSTSFNSEQMHNLNLLFSQPLIGPNAIVRNAHIDDSEELARIVAIENNPDKVRWFENDPTGHIEITQDLAVKKITGDNYLYLAIAGLPTRPDIHEAREDGKLQGILLFNPETNFRLNELKAQKIAPDDSSRHVFEVSYAKWPEAPGGQVQDALRQACKRIIDADPNIDIDAYIMRDERGTNVASVRVLLASGFEEKGEIRYDEAAHNNDRLFVLNRNKLNEIIAQRHASTS